MPNGQDQPETLTRTTTATQQQGLVEELDSEVLAWVAKESFSGTIVHKHLIEWFAGEVLRRDGIEINIDNEREQTIRFVADSFLSRHQGLASALAFPTTPDHKKPTMEEREEDQTRPKGLARLRAKREEEAVYAQFGDAPPLPGQPVAYPQGEIIHRRGNRYVVRHGDAVTKYTTWKYGLDGNAVPNEVLALQFIKEHTTIPVPEVITSGWDRITMKYIEGRTLQQAWPILTLNQRSAILTQLSDYIRQLRAMGGIHLARLDGRGIFVNSLPPRSGGPFSSVMEFQNWFADRPDRVPSQTIYWQQITAQLGTEYPIVFTHGNITASNIIIRNGRIVALLGWGGAGWYPDYWEYVFTLRGMDGLDWKTLGYYVPSLFSERYDLEYILVHFILRVC